MAKLRNSTRITPCDPADEALKRNDGSGEGWTSQTAHKVMNMQEAA